MLNQKHTSWQLNEIDRQLIDLAFLEDLGPSSLDATSALLFPDHQSNPSQAKIISKQPESIILCGAPIIQAILDQWGQGCSVEFHRKDGEYAEPGDVLLTLSGPATLLLTLERTLLNFLQPMSAIATLTAQFVQRVAGTGAQILDTRKTRPGFRHLEKYAVQCGGGVNHRMGLYDAVMVKDTHIDLLGGIEKALNHLPGLTEHTLPVIMELRTEQELLIVLEKGLNKVTRVLLDNMPIQQLSTCVALCKNTLPIEVSGNINLANVRMVAECGVDFISIGKLTHSAGNVDLSMQCGV